MLTWRATHPPVWHNIANCCLVEGGMCIWQCLHISLTLDVLSGDNAMDQQKYLINLANHSTLFCQKRKNMNQSEEGVSVLLISALEVLPNFTKIPWFSTWTQCFVTSVKCVSCHSACILQEGQRRKTMITKVSPNETNKVIFLWAIHDFSH